MAMQATDRTLIEFFRENRDWRKSFAIGSLNGKVFLAPRDTGSPDPETITGRSDSIRSETRWRTEDLRIQRKGDNSEGSCGYGLFKCLGVPNGRGPNQER